MKEMASSSTLLLPHMSVVVFVPNRDRMQMTEIHLKLL
jgi:hypothetical protein